MAEHFTMNDTISQILKKMNENGGKTEVIHAGQSFLQYKLHEELLEKQQAHNQSLLETQEKHNTSQLNWSKKLVVATWLLVFATWALVVVTWGIVKCG